MVRTIPKAKPLLLAGLIIVLGTIYASISMLVLFGDQASDQRQWADERKRVLDRVRHELYAQLETTKLAAAQQIFSSEPLVVEAPVLLDSIQIVVRVKTARLVAPWDVQRPEARTEQIKNRSRLRLILQAVEQGASAEAVSQLDDWLRGVVQLGRERAVLPSPEIIRLAREVTRRTGESEQLLLIDALGSRVTMFGHLQSWFAKVAWPVAQSHKGRQPWLSLETPASLGSFAPQSFDSGIFIVVSTARVLEQLNVLLAREGVTVAQAANEGEWMGPDFPSLRLSIVLADHELRQQSRIRRAWLAVSGILLVIVLLMLSSWLLYFHFREQVHEASRRSEFVSSITHELRTPLTSIRMFAEMLQLANNNSTERRSEYLDIIVHEADRLSRLVDDVLTFARVERGADNYRFRPVALTEVVRAALGAMEYQLGQAGFTVQFTTCEDLPIVEGDADALKQAVLNLLTNAAKYSGDTREICVRLNREERFAVVEVEDRGVGMSAECQRHIFDKFYRGSDALASNVPGAGIGLALVRQIINVHHGEVRVQSQIGHGSTFSILLPGLSS